MEKNNNSPKTPPNNGVDPRINDVIHASSPLKGSPKVTHRRRGSTNDDAVLDSSSLLKESPKVTQTPRGSNNNDDVANDVIEKPEDETTEKEKIEIAINEEKGEEEENNGDNPSHENEEAIDDQYTLEKSVEDVDKFLSSVISSTDHELNETGSVEVLDFVDKFLDLLNEKIENYPKDSSSRTEKFCPNFLEAIHLASKLIDSLDVSKCKEKFSDTINRIGCIQQSAMLLLEDEFRLLLDECRPTFDINNNNNTNINSENNKQKQDAENANEEDQEFSGYPEDSMSTLNRIAKEMIYGGHETECCQVYIMVRRSVFEEILQKLGFESTSIDDVQKMHWENLEKGIAKWINTFTQCANVYFPSESKLSEAVFSEHSSISTHLLCNLSRSVMIHILNFAEAVAMMSRRSAEKLFKFLDMFETLRDVGSTIDGLFHDEGYNVLKSEITTAKSRLGEAIVAIFCDLENSIKSDTGKNPVPGGAVHPLTRYTMNYLEYACEYKETLEQVFKEHLKIERADSTANRSEFQGENIPESSYGDQSELDDKQESPFSIQLMKVVDLLDSNLEGKSKLYKDVSLSNIFIMNNGRYILQHVKRCSELSGLLQEVWRRKKSSELRQCHKNYQRETWGKVLGCFKEEGLLVNGKVVKVELKERFKAFNAMFDEIHKTQSSWVVADEQLQSELRVSISAVVVSAYRSFLGRFSQTFTPGRQSEKYIKYQPEDLETYIDELFDGHQGKKKT